jgi:hypothetical protein
MIPISIPWLVFAALIVFLAGIFFVWICYEIARKRHAANDRKDFIQCHLCARKFTAERLVSLPLCPYCGSPNEHIPPRLF